MNSHASKKDFFYIIVLILTFITVVIGMTFAIYNWFFSQEEGSSAVYTGTLSVQYLSGSVIKVNLLYPSGKPSFDTTKNVYRNNFKVTNTGSLDGILKVDIEMEDNEFSNDTLMYVLYNSSGEELTTGYINSSDSITIANNILLTSNATEEFVLIIWLNENNENQNDQMSKTLTGVIDVNVAQKRD